LWAATSRIPQPISGGADYTDYLPSMNLAFSFPYEITGRFGWAARPRVPASTRCAPTTTPASRPAERQHPGRHLVRQRRKPDPPSLGSERGRHSVEKYFDGKGYFSVAYFFKDLRNYVFDQVTTFDASDLTPPAGYTGPTPNPVGILNGPVNGQGGNVHGFEITASIPLSLFADWLEGFGIVGNFSDTDSSIKRLGPNGPDEPIADCRSRFAT
jgi:iron complex outermembrane receptor protein